MAVGQVYKSVCHNLTSIFFTDTSIRALSDAIDALLHRTGHDAMRSQWRLELRTVWLYVPNLYPLCYKESLDFCT